MLHTNVCICLQLTDPADDSTLLNLAQFLKEREVCRQTLLADLAKKRENFTFCPETVLRCCTFQPSRKACLPLVPQNLGSNKS